MDSILTDAAAVLAWMEDEYLSELLLRGMRPRPAPGAPLPPAVELTWGLVTGTGRLQSYTVRGEGVRVWRIDGEWAKNGLIEVEVHDVPGGIALISRVPGRLEVVCEQLAVARGPVRRYTPPPRPSPTALFVHGPREVTWRELLRALDPPPGLRLHLQVPDRLRAAGYPPVPEGELDTPIRAPCSDGWRLQATPDAGERHWLWIGWSLAITMVGHAIRLERGECDDAAWGRAQRLPAILGPCEVMSGTVRDQDLELGDHGFTCSTVT